MKDTRTDLCELEKQLACPEGEKGEELGRQMHNSNIGMTNASIGFLQLKKQDQILEIGHGNGQHIRDLMEVTELLSYAGVEISETMYKAALSNTKGLNNIDLKLYNGENLPFENQFFDKVFTVNTLYFWKNPVSFLTEIKEVLKSSGALVITFADKEFMNGLPFVGEAFSLYDVNDLKRLVAQVKMKLEEVKLCQEEVLSKSGENVLRTYYMVKITKD